ncbi:MAG TPA: hypothetical protein GX505_06935 [Clostridiales bacterium]|nr:hypothetical protein [Clostridiales bacterium]
MINDFKLELIDAYINKELNSKQKIAFYELLKTDSDFKMLFMQEFELHKQLKQLKTQIDDATKARVLQNIYRQNRSQAEVVNAVKNYFINWSLRMAVPSPILPYINNNILRRCLQ